MSWTVRPARTDERTAMMGILDGAMLAIDADAVHEAIADGRAFVAIDDGRVLGACVLAGHEITAIAVRRTRRDRGIGTALVEAAVDRNADDEPLVVRFDADVRSFYASLGFVIEHADEPGRYRGRRE